MPQKSIAERFYDLEVRIKFYHISSTLYIFLFSFYDLEEENIKLKFHREKDRILCQVERKNRNRQTLAK